MNIQDIMKKASKLQEQLKTSQENSAKIMQTGTSGGGAVSITINGKFEIIDIKIKPEILSESHTDIEEMIKLAYQFAHENITKINNESMDDIKKNLGINIPF